MHDIKFIRQSPEAFDAGLARRGLAPMSANLLKLDEEKRKLLTKIQNWQSEKNKMAKEIGMAKGKGDTALFDELMLKQSISANSAKEFEENLAKIEAALQSLLDNIPNLPGDDIPEGKDEHGNKEVRVVGTKPTFAFKPALHDNLGEKLGLMDFDGAAKLSGARFVVLKGALARMERALASFMLDIHTTQFGYVEYVPPFLVRDNAAYGTGQLPKFKDDLFSTINTSYNDYFSRMLKAQVELGFSPEEARNDEIFKKIEDKAIEGSRFWLIPTAEVPLTNLVNDTIIDEETLPHRLTAYTPCFRSEAGASGKDTRGMIRQHQFSKVELVSIVHPDKSDEEHERMTGAAEEILKRLGLHYRVMLLCTGDMGFCSKKTYDLEVWMPGQDAFREISSCSNCGDFQARRMKARFKGKAAKETQFVHTLNGSGVAIGRTMVAILENYQNEDGSIRIPDALKPYMGGIEKIG